SERIVSGAGEDEPAARVAVERDGHRGAAAEARDVERLPLAGGDLRQLLLRHLPAPEPDRRDDGASANDGSELALEGFGRPFEGAERRRLLVLEGRDDGEELGQLLCRPGAGTQISSPPARPGSRC